MQKRQPAERFSMRCRDGARLVVVAISPDLMASPTGTSTSPTEEASSLPTSGTTTTMEDMTKTPEAVKGVRVFPSLVVVAETTLPSDSFRCDILYLQPCLGGFMVPRLIGTSAARITKLLWNNVTWVGLNMTRREVSCLLTVTENDVCLGEVSERGDLVEVCRVNFKFPITDCTFQPWVPRVIYTSLQGVGSIDFNFELGIKPTKHTFHTIVDDKGANDSTASGPANLEAPRSKSAAPALTCISLTPMRNEVLVGDSKGSVFTFGGSSGKFTRHRQLTFPFPLATLVVAGGNGPLLYLAGVAATQTVITKVAPKSTAKEAATSMKATSTSSIVVTAKSESSTSPSITRSPKTPTQVTASPSPTTATTRDPRKPQPPGMAPKSQRNEERQDFLHGRAPNAGILKVDLSLATQRVFQAVGAGRVLGTAWCRLSRHLLLTTVDGQLGIVHHQVLEGVDKYLMEFAVKPLDRSGGRAVWGSGGWLAYITDVEAVLEREPAILAAPED